MDIVITNIGQLVSPVDPASGETAPGGALRVIQAAELCIRRGRIVADVESRNPDVCRTIDAGGGVILPGLVDPFWVVPAPPDWVGSPEGISDPTVDWAARLLRHAAMYGLTAVEAKWPHGTGAGAAAGLSQLIRLSLPRVIGSLLVSWPEEGHRRQEDLSRMISEVIPEVRQRRSATFMDMSWDGQVGLPDEGRAVLRAATGAGLRPKLSLPHRSLADGLETLATSLSIAALGCASHAPEQLVESLAQAGIIPVYLPTISAGAAPADASLSFPSHGLPVALGSGNGLPGASLCSMWAVMAAGISRMGMRLDQAISACTLGAAAALEMAHDLGSLDVGKCADLILLSLSDYREMEHVLGFPPIAWVMIRGEIVRAP